jgi:outer membrane protein OmpA-like peptidoglycan-associated protein
VLLRSDPEGAWNALDEFAGTSWERSDAQPNPTATAVIELAARARVEGLRITLDDYWTVRLPNEIVIELGDAASGPFREIGKHTLPAELPETGDAHYVVDLPVSAAEGRYLQVRLLGRRGGAEEALGPFLTDVAVHGAFVAQVAPETRAVGSWNGGWLLGTFEILEENGRLRACFSRDGANASVVVDGRSIQLRWKGEDGGDGMALLVRGPDDHLHGTAQMWDADGQGGEPASIDVDPLERAEPICTRTPEPSAIERELQTARRTRVYGILFDFAQHVPRAESNAVLDELAQVFGRHADWSIAIEGHTDAIGDDASNLALSERRAAAVREALASRGVATERTTSVGHGESQPVAPNETAVGRARNRRVEIVLR